MKPKNAGRPGTPQSWVLGMRKSRKLGAPSFAVFLAKGGKPQISIRNPTARVPQVSLLRPGNASHGSWVPHPSPSFWRRVGNHKSQSEIQPVGCPRSSVAADETWECTDPAQPGNDPLNPRHSDWNVDRSTSISGHYPSRAPFASTPCFRRYLVVVSCAAGRIRPALDLDRRVRRPKIPLETATEHWILKGTVSPW